MFKGIRAKVTFTYLVLACVSLVILGSFLQWLLEGYLLTNLQSSLLSQGQLAVHVLAPYLEEEAGVGGVDRIVDRLGQEAEVRVTLIRADGVVLGDSDEDAARMENHRDRPEVKEAMAGGTGTAYRLSSTLNTRMMYVAVPVNASGRVAGVVRLALPDTKVRADLGRMRNLLGLATLVAGLVSVVLSLRLASSLTAPLEEIGKAAKNIAAGNLRHRVHLRRRDEIGDLARTVNEMAATLGAKVSELSTSRQRLAAVLHHMVSGVIVLNHYGNVEMANPAAARFLGLPEAVMSRRHILEVLRHTGLYDRIRQVAASGGTGMVEVRLVHPEERVLQVHLATIPGEDPLAPGVLLVMHDISALRKLEQVRTDFVANVSHELKTPVTAIKGFTETLLDGALEDESTVRRFLGIIDKEATRLINLIKDLLDLSQLETRRVVGEKRPVALNEVAEEVLAELGAGLREGCMTVRMEFPPDLPEVPADRERLRQVLANLVDNAIKYTPAGGEITMGGSLAGEEVQVWVKDTGIGIPAPDLDRVFERFYRVDKGRSRHSGGTGLGLSIVKHIVENHGGRVWVDSEPGRGSTFYFTLPFTH
ncbi:hypothetical protein SY88_19305 [Clostridiales bacterium PH28_bin88]|nr:hypothetical protein SY88_19305 [Clostridiales bacterium PH28_bin88]